ncbi:MAG: cupin domain-containing protein [Novosphingobium sp.]|nr:cupin domain-containing protein [Novosphingobium sp.]
MSDKATKDLPSLEIFRARDATEYGEDGPMDGPPMSDVQQHGMAAMFEAGMMSGSEVKLLYGRPQMSLTYVRFKPGFALPLHSHSANCLYFIITRSIKMGTEELGPGDGFYLGTDVPYTYVPGENGVELLEFRDSNDFDFKATAKNADYWKTLAANMAKASAGWTDDAPLSGMVVGPV